MTAQLDLFAQARDARTDGMARVEDHADPGWLDYAKDFVRRYAEAHPEVHVDDLWDAGLRQPHESRALGPVMQWASRTKLLVRTGRSRPSVHSNLSDKPIWCSTVYDGRQP